MSSADRLARRAFAVMLLGLSTLWLPAARADYVGALETTKYFDQQTLALISSRLAQGGGLVAGDQISYFIQFTPTNNGGYIGAGAYLTDYIPSGTEVIGAQFVRMNADGTYTQVAPPTPASVYPGLVPLYSDTGIFYSTDSRTAVYTNPASSTITASNGYTLTSSGCTKTAPYWPSTSHNAWDNSMDTKYGGGTNSSTSGTCTAPPTINYLSYGLSPVGGPDAYLTGDYTTTASNGNVGPWHRIAYPGSLKGTATGTASYGTGCVGGTPTAAGWNLSPSNPLPIATNAVRFAAGKVTVGEIFYVHITLQLTANLPVAGIINNAEVFGGDAGGDPGSGANYPGEFVQWRYYCPSVAANNSNLLLVKTLVGACTGSGCTPTAVTAGVVPSAANLKLRYTVQYLNSGTTAQTSVVLSDALASGGAFVSGSYAQLSGTSLGTPSSATAGGVTTLTFPTVASLAAGADGKIQYDVNFATAPTDGAALVNTAKLVSTQVPAGVTSKVIATATTKANLWIGKTTSTPSVAPGNTVSYTITVPNNGAGNATSVVVHDTLPSAGGSTAASRFTYVAGSAVATITTAAGVVTSVTPTVADVVATAPPYTGLNREQVTFTLPTATAVPLSGKLNITFSATVGAGVAASASTPYLNDADVWYAGGPGGTGANSNMSETIGTAPVTVTAPMTLTAIVNCVYAGATCVAYTNGTIAPNSKIQYKLSYANISAVALAGVVLADTLPAGTSYVAGTAKVNGSVVTPGISGQLLSFPAVALAAGAAGYATFDVQLGASVVDGTDITDTALVTATSFPAGVSASVTISVRNQANLLVSKTASPASIQVGGTVTYTITVTNNGSAPATGPLLVYDELPYLGNVADPTQRFNFNSGSDSFVLSDMVTPQGTQLVYQKPVASVPPTFTGYGGQTNRQELAWDFPNPKELGPGASFTITYTATAGANLPVSATPYTSDVQVQYVSATNTMYASALNAAPVLIGGLDHLFIQHNSSGLTCMPESLTVLACANAACTSLYTGAVTTTINGVTGAVNLSNGQGSASLAVTTAGPFALATGSTTPPPQNATSCTSPTCTITFYDAGFILAGVAGGNELTVPTQVAGVASLPYVVRAVQKSTTSSACVAALSGNQSIGFGYECNDPANCQGSGYPMVLSVGGGTAIAIQANNNGAGYSYTPINLNFDANGNATSAISFAYQDVGRVTLRLRGSSPTGASLLGQSNAFVVAPHHFAVDACNAATTGDCPLNTPAAPTDGSGAVLAVAGTAASTQPGTGFKTTLRAMAAGGTAATPSFAGAGAAGGSNALENVVLSGQCAAPIVGSACPGAGSLSGSTSIFRAAFNGGTATVSDLAWSEVGAVTLNALDTKFMGVTVNVTGAGNVAGRFRPDHFVITPGSATGACGGAFTYFGQDGVTTPFVMGALNAAGSPTLNYVGAYAKFATNAYASYGFSVAGLQASAIACGGGAAAANGATCGSGAAAPAGVWINGTASLSATQLVTRPTSPVAPMSLSFSALPLDADGVTMTAPAGVNVQAALLEYGRIRLINGNGSELLPLLLPIRIEYATGNGGWSVSASDTCTALAPANFAFAYPVSPTNKLSACRTAATAVNLTNGSGSVRLAAPGSGYYGYADLTLNLGATASGNMCTSVGGPGSTASGVNAPWLRFPWAGNGDADPTARATFGVYKSGPIIYRRELY